MNWEPRLIVALAFLIVAFAAPQGEKELIDFVSSIHEMNADGSYSFDFESEDDTKVSESGSQNQVGPQPEDIGTVSRGSYSYTSPDGVVITVNWIADENGFQATGDHLPTPPPMPEHRLLRLLTSGANNVGRKAPPKGSYSYISPEGVTLTVNWVAKANGIQDTGNRLPTPRMPQQRLLRLLAGANNAGLLAAPKGSYSFTTPDGVVLTVNWVADENGFQATGDHLPTPPPMPEHVVRMLADLKAARLL